MSSKVIVESAKKAIEIVFLHFFDGSRMAGPDFPENVGGHRSMLHHIWVHRVLGFNRHAPIPMAPTTLVSDFSKLHIPSDQGLENLRSPGCYFQNIGASISWGQGVYIGPNVGIITTNHDPLNLDRHLPGRPVHIGSHSWVGMGAVILPGVRLGPHTIVGAGSVVTKSFPDGGCVIAGNPARIVRELETPGVSPGSALGDSRPVSGESSDR